MEDTSVISIQRVLAQVSIDKLGYESLRPKQETVVWEFLSGKDVLVALPTGYGKSCLFAMRF